MPSESSMDLHSELMKTFQNVSLSFQNDEVDEGYKESLQEELPCGSTTTAAQLSLSSSHLPSVREIPHLVEVWGIDPLMKKYFESIYPSSTSQLAQW